MRKKWTSLQIFTIAGALLATEIGSGFATGQETMQFYTAYGWGAILVGILTCLITFFTFKSYAYAGRVYGLKNLREISCFYGGKYLGRLFEVFAWLFCASCYVFMIAGFGSALNQYWGLPVPVGSAIGTALAIITAVLGLKNLVDIVGKIGPVIAILTILVGIASAFTYFPMIPQGVELLKTGEITVMAGSNNSFTSGLSVGGCSVLLCATMVSTLANDYREYSSKGFSVCIAICAITIPVTSLLMGLNLLGALPEVHSAAIPNLILANKFLGSADVLYAAIVILAIYTTICPLLWTSVSPFFKSEKSMGYKIAVILAGIGVYIVTLVFDYATLLNYVMTYGGYCGAFAACVCIVRYIYIYVKDQRSNKDPAARAEEET